MTITQLPADLAGLLRGFPVAGELEQAFPFLTVDEHGFPHSALLSRSELEPSADGTRLLAVISSSRTGANLRRSGHAGLIAVAGTVCHHVKLGVTASVEDGRWLGCAFEVTAHTRDDIGITMEPLTFRTSAALAEQESWDRTAALLAALERRLEQPGG
ncbi:hypothetical protein [Nocardia sp. NPDC020380]|uniref:hypothetical protein n=1 Tax=Nocardia sp. NPDC020380 TaxID=3364309 RepID=UPI003796A653